MISLIVQGSHSSSLSTTEKLVIVACDSRTLTLTTVLAALFAVYFLLKLKYQPEAEASLEFIQRYLMQKVL